MDIKVDEFDIAVRIRLKKQGLPIYGTGVSQLLVKTDQLGSLNSAAKELNMPYKKALFIVRRAEEEFGHQLLEKSIGGIGGGGSYLTEFGHQLVYEFNTIEKKINEYATELIKTRFSH
ncbi:MAG TPA: LysR family transcriptional regulator [Candidatus Merdenecus merdavium]|nr:LysR family transcriptional regulator [Candidatus Merdenecus merdavium]